MQSVPVDTGAVAAPPCTLIREGAHRPCGRPGIYHVLTRGQGVRVPGWLCNTCGTWALQHGRWMQLHAIREECHEGSCGIPTG